MPQPKLWYFELTTERLFDLKYSGRDYILKRNKMTLAVVCEICLEDAKEDILRNWHRTLNFKNIDMFYVNIIKENRLVLSVASYSYSMFALSSASCHGTCRMVMCTYIVTSIIILIIALKHANLAL